MIKKQTTLPLITPPETLRALCLYLPYCAEPVVDCRISAAAPAQLEFSCKREEDVPEIERAAQTLLRALSGDGDPAPFEARTVFDNGAAALLNTEDIFPRLVSEGHLLPGGPGLFGMGKLFLRVFKYFERTCHRLALEQNPDEYVYPTLVPPEYLGGSLSGSARAEESAYLCKTSICLHCYPQFENQVVPKDKPVTITSQGRCFRFEAENDAGRRREFIMRESVYMGDKKFVRGVLADMRKKIENWMTRLRLQCRIETADDFFFAPDPPLKSVFRLMPGAKLELRVALPFGKTALAAASFNFHGPFFARQYNITDGRDYAASGCAKFGIERLTHAFLCQYGLDAERWPADIKNEIPA